MKVRIPKDMRGVVFPRLLPLVVSGFDVDLFLPQLFFRILAGGKQRARRVNDPKNLAKYVEKLATQHDLVGFDDTAGRRVLERLVRTEMVIMGGVGRGGRRGEQILSTVPYTLLTHKVGFPTTTSRHRGVDSFLYHVLRESCGADTELRRYVKLVFGKGVNISPIERMLEGDYDGTTELDTLTRLSIAFLRGFDTTPIGRDDSRQQPSTCPAIAREMGNDLVRYLFAFGERMPAQSLTYNFLALINVELFSYTLKLVHAVNALASNPDILPPAMSEEMRIAAPELYVDFTGMPSGLSHRMAVDCVRRDVEAYQEFLTSNLLLRQLNEYQERLRRTPSMRSEIESVLGNHTSGPKYFQGLLALLRHPAIGMQIQTMAGFDETRIQQENVTHLKESKSRGVSDLEQDLSFDSEEDEFVRAQLEELTAGVEAPLDRVIRLLVEAQRDEALNHFMQWYWSVGGLRKPHGILAGNLRGRHLWRYAPRNDLLAVLVQLAAVRLADGNNRNDYGNVRIQPIRLQDFLTFLETRFGILIDRPPATFIGADYTAAARENLRAMLRRLRQMGIFSDLSDDFTVQRLHPPYADDHISTREA